MLKEIEFKYLVISYGKDNDYRFNFCCFKHKSSSIFKRFSKVIEITLYGNRMVLEF